jgi:dihydrofolate reductase
MRRLVIWNLVTLDGFYDRPEPWNLDFHLSVWGDELEAFSIEQSREIGTLLFGRRTHQGMAAHWSRETGTIAEFMNGVNKVVASRTLTEPGWSNARLLEGDLVAAVETLKHEQGKDIYVFGSGELVGELLRDNLVDAVRLCVAPVTLGAGKPLFPAGLSTSFLLRESRQLQSGGLILFYEVEGSRQPS